MVKHPKKID